MSTPEGSQLLECDGVVKVRHPHRQTPFMLSVIQASGLTGVKAYEIGTKRPARRAHLLLTENVRNWVGSLQTA